MIADLPARLARRLAIFPCSKLPAKLSKKKCKKKWNIYRERYAGRQERERKMMRDKRKGKNCGNYLAIHTKPN